MDCALIFNDWCRFDRIVGWPGCIKNHTPEFHDCSDARPFKANHPADGANV